MKNQIMKTTTTEALARINGSIINASVIYYDDNMGRYYVGPADDLDDLIALMDDEDTSSDAYSHWCAGTCHGDGYETEDEAIAAAESL